MLLLLVVLGFAVYANGRLATSKGRNPVIWGLLTLLGFFVAYGLIGGLYVSMIYKGPVTREALTAYLMNAPLTIVLLLLFGVGGMLLVRYILERSNPEG